jgi:hypothetical protein
LNYSFSIQLIDESHTNNDGEQSGGQDGGASPTANNEDGQNSPNYEVE